MGTLMFWNSSYGATTPIPVASGADLTSALTGKSGDVTLQLAKGGTWGSSAYGLDISIVVPATVTKLTLTYNSGTSGATPIVYLNTLTYSGTMTGGLVIDGLKVITTTANRYLVYSQSSTNFPASVTIQNCWIEGYRAVFYLGSNTNTVSSVTFTNNIFKTIGVSGIVSTGAANNTLTNISITNNTFIDCNAVASAYFIDRSGSYLFHS